MILIMSKDKWLIFRDEFIFFYQQFSIWYMEKIYNKGINWV